jgi:hypothetical protein
MRRIINARVVSVHPHTNYSDWVVLTLDMPDATVANKASELAVDTFKLYVHKRAAQGIGYGHEAVVTIEIPNASDVIA